MSLFFLRGSYLSKYVRNIPKITNSRYFSSPASSSPSAEGFDVVWQRTAAMVVALTERQPSKLLHVYPCENFTKHLSEHSIFDVEGLDNRGASENEIPLPHYSNVHISSDPINSSLETELRAGTYHVVMQCLLPAGPANSADSTAAGIAQQGLSAQELIRVLGSRGYLILGAPVAEFERLGYREQLLTLSEDGSRSPFRGSLISVQNLSLGANSNITTTLTAASTEKSSSNTAAEMLARRKAIGNSSNNSSGGSRDTSSDMYKIALFRKQ